MNSGTARNPEVIRRLAATRESGNAIRNSPLVVRLHSADVAVVERKKETVWGLKDEEAQAHVTEFLVNSIKAKGFNHRRGASAVEASRETRKPVRRTGAALIRSIQEEKKGEMHRGPKLSDVSDAPLGCSAGGLEGGRGHRIAAVCASGTRQIKRGG